MIDDIDAEAGAAVEARPKPRPVTSARWAREQGYVEVTNLTTGETVEIPVRECTPVWKWDLDEIRRRRNAGRD